MQLYRKMSCCIQKSKYIEQGRHMSSYVTVGIHHQQRPSIYLRDGNVQGIPLLTTEGLEHVHKIYGQHLEYVKSKLVRKGVSRTPVDLAQHSSKKEQKLHVDVIHVDGKRFLRPTEPNSANMDQE